MSAALPKPTAGERLAKRVFAFKENRVTREYLATLVNEAVVQAEARALEAAGTMVGCPSGLCEHSGLPAREAASVHTALDQAAETLRGMARRLRRDWAQEQVHDVATLLRTIRFRLIPGEVELQRGIEQAFQSLGVFHERECRLSEHDVIDFLVADQVGVEVKVKGSVQTILRQLSRYAADPRIVGLVLVSRRMEHARAFPIELGGKPLRVVTLEASSL